jgi:pyrroline-5-carboxylate reductase
MATIAFLGAGAMGEALMRGLIEAGSYAPQDIAAFDSDAARLKGVADALGITAGRDAASTVRDVPVVLLAVKPQAIGAALQPLRDAFHAGQTLISIAAGVTTAQLESHFAAAVPCVRVMPNTPCLVGCAASAISLGAHADASHRAIAHRVFDAVGIAVDVEEKLLDAVTGLSGSGPAYVYLFIEALSDAGVKMGLSRDVATRLAAQTVGGAAQMVLETGKHPGSLKDMVTSPAGTTIAGVHALEKNGFRGAVMDAVQAATERSRELSKP